MDTYSVPFVSGLEGFHCIPSLGLIFSSLPPPSPSSLSLLSPPQDGSCKFDFHPYVRPIYSSALKRLRAADIDQEVKERAITCMWVSCDCHVNTHSPAEIFLYTCIHTIQIALVCHVTVTWSLKGSGDCLHGRRPRSGAVRVSPHICGQTEEWNNETYGCTSCHPRC